MKVIFPRIPARIWMVLATILYFFGIRVFLHLNFHTTFADIYYFDHPVWNFIHGKGLFLSLENYHEFGNHFYPYLYLLAPGYFLCPTPIWGFLLQGITLGLLLLPILILAEEWFGKKGLWSTFLLVIATYSFRHAGMVDFHGDIVLAMLISWTLYFIVKEKYNWAWLPIVLMPFAKETFIIATIPIGLYLILVKKKYVHGSAVLVFSLMVAYLLIHVYLPMFRTTHDYSHFRFYSYLGGTFSEMARNALFHPGLLLSHALSAASISYLLLLLLPVSFFCFGTTLVWTGFGIVLQNILSNATGMTDPSNHYTAPLIPIIAISTLLAFKTKILPSPKRDKYIKRFRRVAIFFVGVNILAFGLLELRAFVPTLEQAAVNKAIAMIPSNASVQGDSTLTPHLYYREKFGLFPGNELFDYVLVRTTMSVPVEVFNEWWASGQKRRAIHYAYTGEAFGGIEDYIRSKELIPLLQSKRLVPVFETATVKLYKKVR